MSDITLGVRLKADGSGLVGETRDGERAFDRLGRQVDQTRLRMTGLNRARAAVTTGLRGMTAQLFSLRGALAGLGLGLVSKSFIDAASTSEQYRVRLNVLLGSVQEGNRLFDDMRKFASQVPFEFEEIMGSATQLAGILRGGVDEIGQWMPLIADLAAAAGLGIQETTEQVSRMLSAGAASADLFQQRGTLAMLGFTAGVSYSAEETRKQLLASWNATNSQFRGATEALAKTWTGTMSMLSDKWFGFRNQVMDAGLFDFAKAFVNVIDQDLGTALDGGQSSARRFAETIINGFAEGAKSAGFLLDVFNALGVLTKGLMAGFALLGSGVLFSFRGIAGAIEGQLNVIADVWNWLIEKINAGMDKLPEWARPGGRLPAIEAFDFGMDSAADGFARDIETVRELWEGFTEALMSPVPSVAIEQFMARVRAEFDRIQSLTPPAGGGRGAGTPSPLAPDAAATRVALDEIQQDTRSSLKRLLDSYRDTTAQMTAAWTGWAGQFTSQITAALTGGRASFREFADAVIADLVRIQVQSYITAPLFEAIAPAGYNSGSAPAPAAGPVRVTPAAAAPVRVQPSAAPATSIQINNTVDARGAGPAEAANIKRYVDQSARETEARIMQSLSTSPAANRLVRR